MEWVKLYTTFHDHRKTAELDANAIAMWTLCLSWSGAQDTDGFIPRRIAMRFLGGELGDEAAARLVRSGFWDDVNGDYQMRNWGERQVTAGERDELRLARARAGRQGGLRKAGNRLARATAAAEHGSGNPLAPAQQEPGKRLASAQHEPGTSLASATAVARQMVKQTASRVEESQSRPETPPPTPPTLAAEVVGGDDPPGMREDGFVPREGEPDDFAGVYAAAYRETHAGHGPSGLLLRDIVSAARVCQREGIPLDHIREAVAACARTNGTKEWQFVQALAAVQGGAPKTAAKNPVDAQIEDLLRRAGRGA